MFQLTRAGMPDSMVVIEAGRAVHAAFDERMFNHTLRTHWLAARYAECFSISYDPEQLALACLFHDLGAMPSHYSADRAFMFNSSAALKEYALGHRIAVERIRPMMEAIDYHMSIIPRWDLGNVAGLLQVGTWMDVTGLRSWRIPEAVREARQAFTNRGFFWYFTGCFLRQMRSPRRAFGVIAPQFCSPAGHYCCESNVQESRA